MADPKTIETLRNLGMTEREARLYLALLEKQELNASELHRISGVMRSKAYETLHHMVAKGFCMERVEHKRRFFRAIPPHLLKETLQRQWEDELARKRTASEALFSDLERKLSSRPAEDRSLDNVQLLRSMAQIQRRYLELLEETESEILSFSRSPYACEDPDVRQDQEDTNVDVLRRGVHCRTLQMMEPRYWHWVREYIRITMDKGEEVRVAEHLPMKMFVFDRRKVLFALPGLPAEKAGEFSMLIIEDAGLAESCRMLFDFVWPQAFTLEDWEARGASRAG